MCVTLLVALEDGNAPFPWMTVGYSASMAVIVIADVAVVVWMWRRQWVLPCAHSTGECPCDKPPFTHCGGLRFACCSVLLQHNVCVYP